MEPIQKSVNNILGSVAGGISTATDLSLNKKKELRKEQKEKN